MDGSGEWARPLRDDADLDPLLERIGDARFVAVGEASHGTHEYHEPGHAEAARRALRCFEPFGEDGAEYAFAQRFAPAACEETVVDLLRRLCGIGVVYRPERERWGNYVPTVLGERYDAFLHLEETTPLEPLHLERAGEHVPLVSETV